MKAFRVVLKILAGLAAVAGVVYVIATYGDKIVAWAKNLLNKFSCCGDDCCCVEEDCCCGDDCCCEEEACCCEETCCCEEAAAEEAPAEEAAPAEDAVQAEEKDFEV